jgi:glycerophosphoryl diester phosphodiesterase
MDTIVIAHRGACGYLPEHTLAAKALAHGMGAHYIEQDVVLSRDGVPIVLHDIYLDTTTNVSTLFPKRARPDGRYYAIDFNLEEIRQLRVHERTVLNKNGPVRPAYPERFPHAPALFSVPTLAEEIQLIAGLDRSRNRRTGLYVEMKAPNWHLAQCEDLTAAVLQVLQQTGYAERPDQVFLQCFDDKTLQHLHNEIKTPLPLIQLIGENAWSEDSEVDYDYLQTPAGLDYVASYAAGIGPWLHQIYRGKDNSGVPQLSNLVDQAHQRDLLVHPYTFRADELPESVANIDELFDIFVRLAGVDGFFTDFPDLAINYLERAETT